MNDTVLLNALSLVEYSSGKQIETAVETLMELELQNPHHYDELLRYIGEYWSPQGQWERVIEPLVENLREKKRQCQ